MVTRAFGRLLAAFLLITLLLGLKGASASDLAVDGFFEAAFRGEYGDTQRDAIIRWERPIVFCVKGEYTQEDVKTLAALLFDLSAKVNNLPQMTLTTKQDGVNVVVSFVPEDSMADAVTGYQAGNIGFVWVNYDHYIITDAQIAISTDTSQKRRNAVIREEVVNMLGLLNDITLTKRSIICQEGKTVSDLSAIDYEMLNLLYDPQMVPGTTMAQAREIIGG